MKLELEDFTMNYLKYGQGNPLILLHGNGENCHIFDNLISKLGKNYLVYALDTRGHGKSKMKIKEYHYQDMANDLYNFINKLNIVNPIIFGYSDGAIIALLMKIEHSIFNCNLILAGLNVSPNGIEEKTFNQSIKDSIKSLNLNDRLLAKLMISEPNISKEQLNNLDCKVNLIYGENDLILKDHQIYINQNIKGSTLEIVDGEDHGSYVYDNDKLEKVLEKYLEK